MLLQKPDVFPNTRMKRIILAAFGAAVLADKRREPLQAIRVQPVDGRLRLLRVQIPAD